MTYFDAHLRCDLLGGETCCTPYVLLAGRLDHTMIKKVINKKYLSNLLGLGDEMITRYSHLTRMQFSIQDIFFFLNKHILLKFEVVCWCFL